MKASFRDYIDTLRNNDELLEIAKPVDLRDVAADIFRKMLQMCCFERAIRAFGIPVVDLQADEDADDDDHELDDDRGPVLILHVRDDSAKDHGSRVSTTFRIPGSFMASPPVAGWRMSDRSASGSADRRATA